MVSRKLSRAGGVVLLFVAQACGSGSGCSGCNGEKIPGGFPANQRFDNAMQVRLSQTGVTFLENNFEKLLGTFVPGGLSFTIPASGCSSHSNKICCKSGTTCKANIDLTKVSLDPVQPATIDLDVRATVKTTKIPYERFIGVWGVGFWAGCDVRYDTTRSGSKTLGVKADVDLVVDANNANKLKVKRSSTSFQDFSCGDIKISGGLHCTVVDWLCSLFKGTIENAVKGPVEKAVDGMLKQLPTGTESRVDIGALLSKYAPGTRAKMDYSLWAGGTAKSEKSGVSLGVLGGFRAVKHDACVPDCEASGARCTAPQRSAISFASLFRGNKRPDGKSFDVGIGVHRASITQGLYAAYRSGALCLDVGPSVTPQLNSDLFSLLVPSLATLTGGETVPIEVRVRPRKPPRVELGAGKYHKAKSGKILIDEPLITLALDDVGIDFYAQLDRRYVRLFTVSGDLALPVLLFADADSKLQIILGDLTKALTSVKVTNNDLITEQPAQLAKLLPMVLSLAANFLSDGFKPIALPDLKGIELTLDGGSIRSVASDEILAVFANLALAKQTTSAPLASAAASAAASGAQQQLETTARVDRVVVPPTAAFAVGPRFSVDHGPQVVLRVGADRPAAARGQMEWTYRIGRGFYHPWSDSEQLVIRDPLLWLQGRYRIEVISRIKGQPRTTDATPAVVWATIDTVPPKVELIRTSAGLRAEIRDGVSPADQLQLAWRIGNRASTFGPFGNKRAIEVATDTPVAVKVRDRAGNVARASTVVAALPAVRDHDAAQLGGCSLGQAAETPGPANDTVPSSLLALALCALVRRSRRGRAP